MRRPARHAFVEVLVPRRSPRRTATATRRLSPLRAPSVRWTSSWRRTANLGYELGRVGYGVDGLACPQHGATCSRPQRARDAVEEGAGLVRAARPRPAGRTWASWMWPHFRQRRISRVLAFWIAGRAVRRILMAKAKPLRRRHKCRQLAEVRPSSKALNQPDCSEPSASRYATTRYQLRAPTCGSLQQAGCNLHRNAKTMKLALLALIGAAAAIRTPTNQKPCATAAAPRTMMIRFSAATTRPPRRRRWAAWAT